MLTAHGPEDKLNWIVYCVKDWNVRKVLYRTSLRLSPILGDDYEKKRWWRKSYLFFIDFVFLTKLYFQKANAEISFEASNFNNLERKTSSIKTLFIKLNSQPQGATIKSIYSTSCGDETAQTFPRIYIAKEFSRKRWGKKAGKCLICGQELNEITVVFVLHIYLNVNTGEWVVRWWKKGFSSILF